MHLLALACVLTVPASVERDGYGVAKITAPTAAEAFRLMGRTVAEDRLWQMETSRRVARGQMAEIMGPSALAADKETVKTGYSDEEYDAFFRRLSREAQTAFTEYAAGVNEAIEARRAAGTLPPDYAQSGFAPRPWTVTDSMAIEVMLARRFGTGGAGELRNYALYLYLSTQPCKAKVLDVIDDLAWQNDPASVPTASKADDPLAKSHVVFSEPARAQTEAQLKAVPPVSLLELAPAIRAANGDESRLIAESVQAPYETGSYCVVVSGKRSKTGKPFLMSAPQMGHSSPSIVHEIALNAPGLQVAGIDVPGIPAIVIGNTPHFAWGLTTGVADIADIVWSKGETGVVRRTVEVKVKDAAPAKVEVVRTAHGPVVFESRSSGAKFAQRSSYWMKEVAGWSTLYEMYHARTVEELTKTLPAIAMNMNFFYATTSGETGWQYLGAFPMRAEGTDPRFPVEATPRNAWGRMMNAAEMPHLRNPGSGIIANWNNKPATWWPNMDTPAWGALFRNEVLWRSLKGERLGRWDLEKAAWDIARKDTDTNSAFVPLFQNAMKGDDTPAARLLRQADEWNVQSSPAALLYRQTVSVLRKTLFQQHTGNFTSDALFTRVVQPSVLLKAIKGQTKFDYLAGRKANDVLRASAEDAYKGLAAQLGDEPAAWVTGVGTFKGPDGSTVLYGDRGTYIQITELTTVPAARSVASPGVSESGPHTSDQLDLAKQWSYKPVWKVGD
ncbi:MAG: penicillin acylase family protein [Armatimonadetes bacterium]|nr:penicillin acylase family protein [Armatimonadota bacterium]